jgi:hypothetical protein
MICPVVTVWEWFRAGGRISVNDHAVAGCGFGGSSVGGREKRISPVDLALLGASSRRLGHICSRWAM